MASRLSDRLLATGLVPLDGVRAAIARQAVYGGALDTALLELDAIDEGTLWGELAAATELGIPDRALCEAPQKLVKPDGSDALDLDASWSARCRAVPVGLKDGALQILCGEPVARAEIEAATRALADPLRALRRAGDLDRGRPAGDLRPADGAAAGAPLRAGRRRRAGAALASGAHARAAADAARARRRDPAARLPPPVSAPRPAEPATAPPAPVPARSRRGGATGRAPPVEPAAAPAPHDKGDVPGLIERLEERGRRRGGARRAGGDHQAGLRAEAQALGELVEAARGRRPGRLAVRGALAQDRRDPGRRRAGAARADRRVLRLRLRSPPRRPRGGPRPLAGLVDRRRRTAGCAIRPRARSRGRSRARPASPSRRVGNPPRVPI